MSCFKLIQTLRNYSSKNIPFESHALFLNMGFSTLNTASLILGWSGCCSLTYCLNIILCVLVLEPFHSVMKEDETESLAVAWRNRWLTHPLKHVMLLFTNWTHIPPRLTFCLQLSGKVLVAWIIRTWWEFKIQSMLSGRKNNVLRSARRLVLFRPWNDSGKSSTHDALQRQLQMFCFLSSLFSWNIILQCLKQICLHLKIRCVTFKMISWHKME